MTIMMMLSWWRQWWWFHGDDDNDDNDDDDVDNDKTDVFWMLEAAIYLAVVFYCIVANEIPPVAPR